MYWYVVYTVNNVFKFRIIPVGEDKEFNIVESVSLLQDSAFHVPVIVSWTQISHTQANGLRILHT